MILRNGWTGGSARCTGQHFLKKPDPASIPQPPPGIAARPLVFPPPHSTGRDVLGSGRLAHVAWLRPVLPVGRGLWGREALREGVDSPHLLGSAPGVRRLHGPGILGQTDGLARPRACLSALAGCPPLHFPPPTLIPQLVDHSDAHRLSGCLKVSSGSP